MKKINRLLIISLLILISSISRIYADTKDSKDMYNILLINSYDIDNKWENRVKDGLKEVTKDNPNINIKTEYLDIRNNNNEYYIRDFETLLNTKYKDNAFDMIITVDDEAFNLVRNGLFDKNNIFYKKIIVFTGVNERINLTSQEKKYITGFMDSRSKIEIIKLISKLHPNAININVLLDNTNYSKDIKEKLLENAYLLDNNINLNFIQGRYENEILEELKKIDESNQAVLVCGVYKDKNSNNYIKPEELITKIKDIKDQPIYTSIADYIGKGTVGGYVDIGVEYGNALGKMVLKIYEDKSISQVPLINKLGGNYVVDYQQIYNYKRSSKSSKRNYNNK